MALEPFERKRCDVLQRSRFFEQVGRSGDHFQSSLDIERSECGSIELEHLHVEAPDDQ